MSSWNQIYGGPESRRGLPSSPTAKPRAPSKPKARRGALTNFDEQTLFLLTENGYRSGFKVKPTRVMTGRSALVKQLRALAVGDALNRGVIPYGVVVYAVSADAAPVKVDKEDLQLAVLDMGRLGLRQEPAVPTPGTRASGNQVPGVAPQGGSPAGVIVPPDPSRYMRGRRITYDELKKLPDGAVVWVLWTPPDKTHGEPINGPHTLRRSGSKGSSRHPVWYLTDMVHKFEELFTQSSVLQGGNAAARDEDGVELFYANL